MTTFEDWQQKANAIDIAADALFGVRKRPDPGGLKGEIPAEQPLAQKPAKKTSKRKR